MKNSRLLIIKKTTLALAFTSTCIVLSACSKRAIPISIASDSPTADRGNPTQVSTPVKRQTSRQLVSSDPRGQYLVIKRTLSGLAPDPAEALEGEPYDLEDCKTGGDYLGVSDDPAVLELANLAYVVVHLSKTLPKLGYPESVWSPLLVQFENEQLNLRLREIGRPYNPDSPSSQHANTFKEKLVRLLNSYRAKRATELPTVFYQGDCGAGDVSINFRTEPEGGRAMLIPVFFYELCKAQQYDPENRSQCTWWVDPPEGAPLAVSGDYFFRASWPDGVQRQGRTSFDAAQDGQTFIIRKP